MVGGKVAGNVKRNQDAMRRGLEGSDWGRKKERFSQTELRMGTTFRGAGVKAAGKGK